MIGLRCVSLAFLVSLGGMPLLQAQPAKIRDEKATSHTRWVWELKAEMKGKQFYSLGDGLNRSEVLRAWDLQTLKPIPVVEPLKTAWSIALSSNGKKTAFSTVEGLPNERRWVVYLADDRFGKPVKVMDLECEGCTANPALFFLPDERTLVCHLAKQTGAEFFLHDGTQGTKPVEIKTKILSNGALAKLIPGTSLLALVSGFRRTIVVYDLEQRGDDGDTFKITEDREINFIECLRYQRKILVGFDDGTIVRLDCATRLVSDPVKVSKSNLLASVLSDDDHILYTGNVDGSLQALDLKRNKVSELFQTSLPIYRIALVPGTSRIAVASGDHYSNDEVGRISIVDLVTREVEAVIENDRIYDPYLQRNKDKW